METVDLTEEFEEDCILQSFETKKMVTDIDINSIRPKKRKKSIFNVFMEKCISLENSDGMHKVINNSLKVAYNKVTQEYKESSVFKKAVHRTIKLLEDDPSHKYCHIKNLRDILIASTTKKRVKPITIATNIRDKRNKIEGITDTEKKRLNEISSDDVVVIDGEGDVITDSRRSIEEIRPLVSESETAKSPIELCKNIEKSLEIDVDQEDNSPILIEDDRIASASERVSAEMPMELCEDKENDIIIDISRDSQNTENLLLTNRDTVPHTILGEVPIEFCGNSCEDVIDISQDEDSEVVLDENRHLVPQVVVERIEIVQPNKKSAEIHAIEQEIAHWKKIITNLDEQEVIDDNCASPYIRSDKLKAKIVQLYKKLCELNGQTPIKGRRVHLKVMNGHPKGPIKRLENFLNKNIGSEDVTFPDFSDVVRCVTKANEADGLGWSRQQVMKEAALIFTHCGRELQKQRQRRDWKDMLSRVKTKELKDPADEDPELLARLQANKHTASQNESAIFERYAKLQNTTNAHLEDTRYVPKIDEINIGCSISSSSISKTQINNNKEPLNRDSEKDLNNSEVNNRMHNNIDTTIHINHKIEITVDENFITYVDYPNDKNELIVRNCNDTGFVNGNDAANLTDENLNMEYSMCRNEETLATLQENTNYKLSNSIKSDFDDINSNKELSIKQDLKNEATLENLSDETILDVRKIDCEGESEVTLKGLSKNGNSMTSSVVEPIEDIKERSCETLAITKEIIKESGMSNENDGINDDSNFNLISVKKEDDSDEDIVKLLNQFGPNYTTTIFDIYDPFLVIELSSDSSDEEFE